MKNKLFFVLLGIFALSLVGCENKNKSSLEEPSTSEVDNPIIISNPVDNRANNDIITSVNKLGFQLQDKISKTNSDNTLISPYSISIAFSMLDNMADDTTKEQIESVLGITDLNEWNEQVSNLFSVENVLSDAGKKYESVPKLITSDSFWIDKDLKLSKESDDVINIIKDNYNGDIFKEDFSNRDTSEKIDKWIDKSTNGLIKNLGADVSGLDSLLINTIYFKGSWVYEFSEHLTEERDFRTNDGVSQVMSMRLSNENFYYINENGLEAISLPYHDYYNEDVIYGNFDMVIIKSTDDDLTTDKFDNLSIEEKLDFLNDLSNVESATYFKTIQIPKFKYEYDYKNIKNDLISLGIVDVFNPDSADLSKINSNLYVSGVKHKAVISVDEYGTEAAAMTALMMECAMALPEEPSVNEFIVDKPFTYIIRNSDTGLIYFIGEVNSL